VYNSIGSEVTINHHLHDYISSRPGQPYNEDNWMIRNYPMVSLRSAGTLSYMAAGRIKGKPHVIGEYYSPYPNQYNVEHWTLLPAWGAYQDWDGVFMGYYARSAGELFADSLPNFFRNGGDVYSFGNNPAVLAVVPFASTMFREALIKPAEYTATLTHDPDDVWLYPAFVGNRVPYGVDGNLEVNVFTQMKLEQSFNQAKHKVAAEYPYVADTAAKLSDTKELRWDQGSGRFTVTTPYLYAACGLYTTDTAQFPTFSVTRTDRPSKREHLSVYLYPLDTTAIDATHDALMTIATRAQNTGVTWVDSNGWAKNFGSKPTVVSAPTLHVQFVSDLDSVFVYPLDNRGQQTGVKLIASRLGETNRFFLNYDVQFREALWYRVVHKAADINQGVDDRGAEVAVLLSPNPASEYTTIRYSGIGNATYRVFDALGRVVHTESTMRSIGEDQVSLRIDCSHLPVGSYTVVFQAGANTTTRPLHILR
jgi:hypothetical protein